MRFFKLFSIFVFLSAIFTDVTAIVDAQKIKKSELKLDRKATVVEGFFQGIKKKKQPTTFKIKDCQFLYERGYDEHPNNSREYKFDRFIVNFLGPNEEGESAFDSVTYSHSEYLDNYEPLKFTKSFGPVSLVDVTKAAAIGSPSMTFVKHEVKAEIIFEHIDVFDETKNSSFFLPGEKRKVKTHFFFKRFDEKKIDLDKVTISSKRLKKDTVATEVSCSSFVNQ